MSFGSKEMLVFLDHVHIWLPLFNFLPTFFSGNRETKSWKISSYFSGAILLYYFTHFFDWLIILYFMVAFQLFPCLVVIWSSVWSTHNPQSIKIKVHLSQYHSKLFLMSSSYAEWCNTIQCRIFKNHFPIVSMPGVPPVQKHIVCLLYLFSI